MNRTARTLVVLGAMVIAAGFLMAAVSDSSRGVVPTGLVVNSSLIIDSNDLYVDVEGLDSDRCGPDPLYPCRTIDAALAKVPMANTQDVTIHIAAGTYPGGILISGRHSPNGSRVILSGQPGATFITGPPQQQHGILVVQSSGIVLENLSLSGFPGAGVRVLLSTGVELRSLSLTENGDGVFLGAVEARIADSSFLSNAATGVTCNVGWLTLGSADQAPLIFTDNPTAGLQAIACHASLESPVTVTGSDNGLLAMHGGEIMLNMRPDIGVYAPTGCSALTADRHGVISGFSNSCVGACECLEQRYGICEATAPPAPPAPPVTGYGGGRRIPMVESF